MGKRREKKTIRYNTAGIFFIMALFICISEKESPAGEVAGNTTTRGLTTFQGGSSRGSSSDVASFSRYSTGSDRLATPERTAQPQPNIYNNSLKVNMSSPFSGMISRPRGAAGSGQMGGNAGIFSQRRSNSIPPSARILNNMTPSTSFKPIRQRWTSNIFRVTPKNLGRTLSVISTSSSQKFKGLTKPSVLSLGGGAFMDLDFQKQASSAYNSVTNNTLKFGGNQRTSSLIFFKNSDFNARSQPRLGLERISYEASKRALGQFGATNSTYEFLTH